MNTTASSKTSPLNVAVIGGGPAGLMAAEVIAEGGFAVSVYDAMPSLGRKFLLAGVGGMNITHAESSTVFLTRYGSAASSLTPIIEQFDAQALRDWAQALGIETFIGSSGRVFPSAMKAAPLLRAWLHRLRERGVKFFPRHQWLGWTDNGELRFQHHNPSNQGYASSSPPPSKALTEHVISPSACVLALGGASWPRLGSDGSWVPRLRERHVEVTDLQPSNCGFDIAWSDFFRERCAGEPLNTVTLRTTGSDNIRHQQRGEATLTEHGIEGNLVYALSAVLREQINHAGHAELFIDLLPDLSEEKIFTLLQKPKGKDSLSNYLRKQLKLPPIKIHLLRELAPTEAWQNNSQLARSIKALSVKLLRARPISEAISSAGGIQFSALNSDLMLNNLPGVFCAGEMLDWEAPTGGYLLTACFATGKRAGKGVTEWLNSRHAAT